MLTKRRAWKKEIERREKDYRNQQVLPIFFTAHPFNLNHEIILSSQPHPTYDVCSSGMHQNYDWIIDKGSDGHLVNFILPYWDCLLIVHADGIVPTQLQKLLLLAPSLI